MDDLKAAIKTMNSWKAGGADGVTAEMFKAEGTETPPLFVVHIQ